MVIFNFLSFPAETIGDASYKAISKELIFTLFLRGIYVKRNRIVFVGEQRMGENQRFEHYL